MQMTTKQEHTVFTKFITQTFKQKYTFVSDVIMYGKIG
jgi:hypothetical protein